MKNGDQLAYPVSESQHTGFSPTHEKIYTTVVSGGFTKREVFAMAAMQGIIANSGGGPPDVAHRAVVMADELLKALEE